MSALADFLAALGWLFDWPGLMFAAGLAVILWALRK